MESTLHYLKQLSNETHKPESEIFSLAFQTGVRQLWREHILDRYLRNKISREDAVQSVGIDWVELTERQYEAMQEDMNWALND